MLLRLEETELAGQPVDAETIKTMVDYYRKNRRKDTNSIKFAHFPLAEVIKLLTDNGIISQLPDVDLNKIRSYGVKLYLANHANDISTCPTSNPNYINSDTIVTCITQLVSDGGISQWKDLLDTGSLVGIPGSYSGKGLDKSTICPPDCPSDVNPYTDDISSIK